MSFQILHGRNSFVKYCGYDCPRNAMFELSDKLNYSCADLSVPATKQKESRLLKDGQAQAMARDTAHHTAEQILSSHAWKKPPLYDVVYRIPEASLKLARDDRQAGLWYRQERKMAEAGPPPAKHQPAIVSDCH